MLNTIYFGLFGHGLNPRGLFVGANQDDSKFSFSFQYFLLHI